MLDYVFCLTLYQDLKHPIASYLNHYKHSNPYPNYTLTIILILTPKKVQTSLAASGKPK